MYLLCNYTLIISWLAWQPLTAMSDLRTAHHVIQSFHWKNCNTNSWNYYSVTAVNFKHNYHFRQQVELLYHFFDCLFDINHLQFEETQHQHKQRLNSGGRGKKKYKCTLPPFHKASFRLKQRRISILFSFLPKNECCNAWTQETEINPVLKTNGFSIPLS